MSTSADGKNNNNNNSGNARGGGAAIAASASRSLDPVAPLLVQPYKRLVDEGFITELSVTFTPMGVAVSAKIDARVAAKDKSFVVGSAYPVAAVAKLADVLIPRKAKAKKSSSATADKPKKSLVVDDFSDEKTLAARAGEVAKALGPGGIVGRIGSGGMLPPESMQFDKWWAGNGLSRRLSLLTVEAHRAKIRADVPAAPAMMASLGCPFRDSLEIRASAPAEEAEDSSAAPSAKE